MMNTVFKSYNVLGDDIYYHHTSTTCSDVPYLHGPETHSQYEVLYLLEGELSYIIEGETYDAKRGDMIFVAPNEIHTLRINASTPYERVVLLFNMEILHKLMEELAVTLNAFSRDNKDPFHIIKADLVSKYGLDHILLAIIREDDTENHKKMKILSHLIRFVLAIDSARSEQAHTPPTSSDKIVRAVSDYVSRHIDEPIRLDDLANMLFISKSTLCHRFSSLMNMTVNRYIIIKKMNRACSLLRDGCGAHEAAEAVGYENYTSFFYNFKKTMGFSPAEISKRC